MAADDGDLALVGVRAGDLAEEASRTDDVEGRDTEDAAGVVDTGLLQGLGDDRDGGVNGVGDDEKVRVGGSTGNSGSKVADDARVGLYITVSLR